MAVGVVVAVAITGVAAVEVGSGPAPICSPTPPRLHAITNNRLIPTTSHLSALPILSFIITPHMWLRTAAGGMEYARPVRKSYPSPPSCLARVHPSTV